MNARFLLPLTLLCAACLSGSLSIDVHVLTQSCRADRSPLTNVSKLRFTLTGDGIPAPIIEDNIDLTSGNLTMSSIPAGTGRRLRVEALNGPSPEGVVVARGDSGRFDVTGTSGIAVTVFVRPIDAFSPTNRADAPTQCSTMTMPRAGHTMTTMSDGRVLITGGFTTIDGITKNYLQSAEIYDPRSGSFTPAAMPHSARAFAAAAPLTRFTSPNMVFVSGGEFKGDSAVSPLRPAETYDGSNDAWSPQILPMKTARSHHTATEDNTGRVLIAGGIQSAEGPAPSMVSPLEFYDPAQAVVKPSATLLSSPRANHAAVTLQIGAVLLIGGSDEHNNALDTMEGFVFVGNDYTQSRGFSTVATPNFKLGTPHARPAAALLASGTRVIVAGGFAGTFNTDARYDHVTDTTEIVDTVSDRVFAAPSLAVPRAEACAAALDDGGALIIGGATRQNGTLVSFDSADLYNSDASGSGVFSVHAVVGPMKDARNLFSCAKLPDGSVLVAGGIKYGATSTGTPTVTTLDTAEIYMPVGVAH